MRRQWIKRALVLLVFASLAVFVTNTPSGADEWSQGPGTVGSYDQGARQPVKHTAVYQGKPLTPGTTRAPVTGGVSAQQASTDPGFYWEFTGQDGCCGNVRYRFYQYTEWHFNATTKRVTTLYNYCGKGSGYWVYDGCSASSTPGGQTTIRVWNNWTYHFSFPFYTRYNYPGTDCTFITDGRVMCTWWSS